jgi:hypothetical protein
MPEKSEQYDSEKLVKGAYEMGYSYYEHSVCEMKDMLRESDNPRELWLNGNEDTYPLCELATEGGYERNSHGKMVAEIEDKLGVGPKYDWDSMGVYGIIEDCCIAWETAAYDALLGNDYDPEKLMSIDS